ncbi:MAG: rRNA (guanine966-N2)-methyltransferase [Actinomycetota bacterium]|jgi:16S rRNA (guanine966-N2)-methyltransferase|nr:rRNA (guanine966-N2)-methyltransferase [Actinomycetota bacterium]
MPRIVAGQVGGRRLAVPPSGTRPTSDRAREALFSSLESQLGGLAGRQVLDLYAGSGAVGLEAWSRGAALVVLVESASAALKVLRANVASLRAAPHASAGKIEVVGAKVERAVTELSASGFDVVFADPPYDLPAAQLRGALATLATRETLRHGAVVVVERASRERWTWPAGYRALHDRKYGDSTLHYAAADSGSL